MSRKRRTAENEVPEQTEQGTCGEEMMVKPVCLPSEGKMSRNFPTAKPAITADTVLMMVWRL